MSQIKQHIDFYLIGISNHPTPKLLGDTLEVVKQSSVFSGGKRHYELIKTYLPQNHTWIEISGKMEVLIERYQNINLPVVVFVSGDPFFYGFGNTLKRLMPNAKLRVYPYFNSIQLLCHKTQTNYNQLQTVSVHGRDWSALDVALINRSELIGVLTDSTKTPAKIAKRMLQYGFDNYSITVGESLDGQDENIEECSLLECSSKQHEALNCVILKQTAPKKKLFGMLDHSFVPLPNRANMITKMPIRLSTINALKLHNAIVFWDIGACTASVTIEAKQHFPNLKIVAFEKRIECKTIIQQNIERHSTPGIDIVIDDFFNLNLNNFPVPDVVFIGGHGGRLAEMIDLIYQINPTVRFVINAVKESSSKIFIDKLIQLDYIIDTTTIQVDNYNVINIHSGEKLTK